MVIGDNHNNLSNANTPLGAGAESIGLNYIEYFSKMKDECNYWKELALANRENRNVCIYYAAKWNEALASFKKRFHIIYPG